MEMYAQLHAERDTLITKIQNCASRSTQHPDLPVAAPRPQPRRDQDDNGSDDDGDGDEEREAEADGDDAAMDDGNDQDDQ